MLTEQELIDKGFRKWKSNDISFPYSDFFFQKKFVDDVGVKYFVDVVHYPVKHYPNGNIANESWKIHQNINEPHMRFDQHDFESLDNALEKCEKFFQTMGCEYYEKNYTED
jgi:hypothetical protein